MSSAIALVEFDSKSRAAVPDADRHFNATSSLGPVATPLNQTDYPLSNRREHAPPAENAAAAAAPATLKLRGGKAILLSLQLCLYLCANAFTTGLITIGIVDIGADLGLDASLVYWPVLAYNLTSSPLLIPFGAVADVFGARPVVLLGSLGCGLSVIACGLARDGYQLIAFRCLQGLASALLLPTIMGIVSTSMASGKIRNVALACIGLATVVGYALGLVLGGVFLDSIGWRFGYYLSGGAQLVLFLIGFRTIPSVPAQTGNDGSRGSVLHRLNRQMDWIGALISCACIGMISYVLAVIAESVEAIKQPSSIALLILSALLVPAFISWMRFQERRNKPALMPGSLWKPTFTTICIIVAFANAEMQCFEFLTSLFFQNVQALSPLDSSLRLLPSMIAAAAVGLVTGNIVHRLKISWALATGAIIAMISPLLMALINPSLPYWYEAFPAQLFYPFCIDFVFVVSALVISDSFPERDQALAGAVFNTVSNLGQALGLAITAVITNAVTRAHESDHQAVSTDDAAENGAQGLLEGYRAGFWLSVSWMLLTAAIGALGLRKADAIGVKRD